MLFSIENSLDKNIAVHSININSWSGDMEYLNEHAEFFYMGNRNINMLILVQLQEN